jgi:hypothetical protein
MKGLLLKLMVIVALLHISGCGSPSSPVLVKTADIEDLKVSEAIVWGYIESGTVHYVKMEKMPLVLRQGEQQKDAGSINAVKPYGEVSCVPRLSKIFEGYSVEFVMLMFHNTGTGQDFTTKVGAEEGLQPFYVILPEGQYNLIVERFGSINFKTKSPKVLDVVGGKYAFYIGDLEMVIVNEERTELHDYGKFQERQSEFFRNNPDFMGEVVERRIAHGEYTRGLFK